MKEDCDKDTLLIQVHPVGPVCHTGTDTCWGEKNEQPVMFLKLLQDFIDKRHAEMPEGLTQPACSGRVSIKWRRK